MNSLERPWQNKQLTSNIHSQLVWGNQARSYAERSGKCASLIDSRISSSICRFWQTIHLSSKQYFQSFLDDFICLLCKNVLRRAGTFASAALNWQRKAQAAASGLWNMEQRCGRDISSLLVDQSLLLRIWPENLTKESSIVIVALKNPLESMTFTFQ